MENGTVSPALNGTLSEPLDDSTGFKVIALLLIILVCGLGILGNIVVIVVVAITKQLNTPVNSYLVSLAVADLMVLIAAGLPAATGVIAKFWVFGHYACPVFTFFQYLGINTSSAFIAAITIERYITICHPQKALTLCTIPRAKICTQLIWTLNCLYSSMWLYLAKTEEVSSSETQVVCGYRVKRKSYLPIYFVDLTVFFLVPLLLATIMFSLIARVLYSAPLPADPRATNVETGDQEDEDLEASSTPQGRKPRHISLIRASRRQVTKMMAVLVILFTVLWMPYRTLVVVNSFLTNAYLDRDFLLFCRLCIYLNSAINPVVYSAMSLKFRAAVRQLLHCDGSAEDDTGESQIQTQLASVAGGDC